MEVKSALLIHVNRLSLYVNWPIRRKQNNIVSIPLKYGNQSSTYDDELTLIQTREKRDGTQKVNGSGVIIDLEALNRNALRLLAEVRPIRERFKVTEVTSWDAHAAMA